LFVFNKKQQMLCCALSMTGTLFIILLEPSRPCGAKKRCAKAHEVAMKIMDVVDVD